MTPALMMGAYRALAVTLYFLGDFETADNTRCVVFRSGARGRTVSGRRGRHTRRRLSLL